MKNFIIKLAAIVVIFLWLVKLNVWCNNEDTSRIDSLIYWAVFMFLIGILLKIVIPAKK